MNILYIDTSDASWDDEGSDSATPTADIGWTDGTNVDPRIVFENTADDEIPIIQPDEKGEDETNILVPDVSLASRKAQNEALFKHQTELTRSDLLTIAEMQVDEITQDFGSTTAAIIHLWQSHAKEDNPTSHQIDFGFDVKLNLLMVLALLPERLQFLILIEDQSRSPHDDGDGMSWLHEDTMNAIVGLSHDTKEAAFCFGRGLASMVCEDIDSSWQEWYGKSYLECQIQQMLNDDLDTSVYEFPASTEKLVFFFNPTGIHWTVVEVKLCDETWTYELYNSYFQGEKGGTWKSCKQQLPLLEELICGISGIARPDERGIVTAVSAQQSNHYDCGVISVYNAIEILQGRVPETAVDTEQLRLTYLKTILSRVRLLSEESHMQISR